MNHPFSALSFPFFCPFPVQGARFLIFFFFFFFSLSFFCCFLGSWGVFLFLFRLLILRDVWVPGRLISQKKVLNHTYAATSQNRGRTSPPCRYDSWKRGPTAFPLARSPVHSTSSDGGRGGKNPLNDDRLHFIICFSQFFFLPCFLTRWQGCHPRGRARSFTSLMNTRTISNKCHRCPNCQIYSQLKKKIKNPQWRASPIRFCHPASLVQHYKLWQSKQPRTKCLPRWHLNRRPKKTAEWLPFSFSGHQYSAHTAPKRLDPTFPMMQLDSTFPLVLQPWHIQRVLQLFIPKSWHLQAEGRLTW